MYTLCRIRMDPYHNIRFYDLKIALPVNISFGHMIYSFCRQFQRTKWVLYDRFHCQVDVEVYTEKKENHCMNRQIDN